MRTAIVTDSTAYLPADLVERYHIGVVPLHVVIGGREYSEGIDVGSTQVAEALRSFTPVSTSRPSPHQFAEVYDAVAAEGAEHIVSVHLSAQMSGTVGGAELAARDTSIPVSVVDSWSIGMAMGYAVVAGAEAAAGGASGEQVAALVRARCRASNVVFYVDTLEHLRRGGRIGAASAFVGSALAIKPILGLAEGHIVPVEKVRTTSRAIARLEELAESAAEHAPGGADGIDLAVHHLDNWEKAEPLMERLRARIDDLRDVRLVELGAVVGAHVGPGTIAVAISPRVTAR